jgi:hypothetical protein
MRQIYCLPKSYTQADLLYSKALEIDSNDVDALAYKAALFQRRVLVNGIWERGKRIICRGHKLLAGIYYNFGQQRL